MHELEQQIINFEIKLAHMEKLFEDLSDVLISQQKQIDKIDKTLNLLNKKVQANQNAELEIGPANERPPHY